MLSASSEESERGWGAQRRDRYAALIERAIALLAEERLPTGCKPLDPRPGTFTFHLRNVRGRGSERIAEPPHFLIMRVLPSGEIQLLRVAHQARDLLAMPPRPR